MSRQESECRRQISLLEARLLETGVKNSRRRDLLQLQVCVVVSWAMGHGLWATPGRADALPC